MNNHVFLYLLFSCSPVLLIICTLFSCFPSNKDIWRTQSAYALCVYGRTLKKVNTYDLSGRRIEKDIDGDTTTYVYTETHASNRRDGGNVIAEYDDNGDLASKYIHGARVDELVCMIDVADSSAVYYYHYDGLGSVVAKRTYPENRLYCGRLQRPIPALSVQKRSQRSLGYACEPF